MLFRSERPLNALVCATGFDTSHLLSSLTVTGQQGRTLRDAWASGPTAYHGISVAGFPNLFTLMGPNTGPGHTSVLVYTEAQMDYARQAIQACVEKNIKSVTMRDDKQAEFNEELGKKMERTTWGGGGSSWYYTKDGRNTTLYPGFATEYVLSVRKFDLDDYAVKTA